MGKRSDADIAAFLAAFRKRAEEKKRRAFDLTAPAIVSFSGGRTSGYMLRLYLDLWGGSLPPGVQITFCNTGLEREESLEFVHEVGKRWCVPVVWLEYRYLGWDAGREEKHSFAVVDFATASRKGEPFSQIIEARNDVRRHDGNPLILPNQSQRWCTGELKQKTKKRYLSSLGIEEFQNAIGIRADEPSRYMSVIDCTEGRLAGETPLAPLFDAGIDLVRVMEFWASQPFDLRLQPHEGNCDLCFLKQQWKHEEVLRRLPYLAEWWAGWEERTGERFRRGRPSYRELPLIAAQPRLFCDSPDAEEQECHCTD